MSPRLAEEHPGVEEAIPGKLLMTHGTDPRMRGIRRITVGTAVHVDQRLLGSRAVSTLLRLLGVLGKDVGMDGLAPAEHRPADGAGSQHLKRASASPGHPVCQIVIAASAQFYDGVRQVADDCRDNQEDDGVDCRPPVENYPE